MLALAFVWGCRSLTPPPYARHERPGPRELLATTAPRISAIQVPSAKVKANRAMRGDLSLIAQAPSRFRGRVHAKGNELATLAFHERGYALRYLMDDIQPGYYSGPPSDCAAQALLGVSFPLDGLVALVLGGGPIIATPYEVTGQRWNRRTAREVLALKSASFEQELEFVLRDGVWWFAGATLWQSAGTERGAWLWTVQHTEFHRADGGVLPERTQISVPGKRRDIVVSITYREQNVDPPMLAAASESGASEPGATEPGDDDDWEDDEGWEDAAPADVPDAPSAPAPSEKSAAGSSAPADGGAASQVPEVFLLSSSGLTDRGDLCAAQPGESAPR